MEFKKSNLPSGGKRCGVQRHKCNSGYNNGHALKNSRSLQSYVEYKTKKENSTNDKDQEASTGKTGICSRGQNTADAEGHTAELEKIPKKRWTVTYDNRNYIRSQMSQDVLEQLVAEKKKFIEERNKMWRVYKPEMNEND